MSNSTSGIDVVDRLPGDRYEKIGDSHTSYDTICEQLISLGLFSVVAVDGPSNGGKTSLAKALVSFYERQGTPVSFIPLDYFMMDRATRSVITQTVSEGRLPIAEYSGAGWEQDRYHETIVRAKQLSEHASEPYTLSIPNAYDRQTGTKENTETVIIHPGGIIVTEGVGIHAHHRECFTTTIRVDASNNDILYARVLKRERQKAVELRLSDDFLRTRYETVDAPHTDYLRANVSDADFIIDTSDFNKILLYKHF